MTPEQETTMIGLLTEIRDLLRNGGAGNRPAPGGRSTGVAAHFSKLRDDSWGVRAAKLHQAGETIDVETKSGAIQKRRLLAIVSTGNDRETGKPYWVWSVYARDGNQSAPPASRPATAASKPAAAAPAPGPEEDDVPF